MSHTGTERRRPSFDEVDGLVQRVVRERVPVHELQLREGEGEELRDAIKKRLLALAGYTPEEAKLPRLKTILRDKLRTLQPDVDALLKRAEFYGIAPTDIELGYLRNEVRQRAERLGSAIKGVLDLLYNNPELHADTQPTDIATLQALCDLCAQPQAFNASHIRERFGAVSHLYERTTQ